MRTITLMMVYRVSLLFISFLAVACKKNSDPKDDSNEQLYTLSFDLQDFEATTKPLNSLQKASAKRIGALKTTNGTSQGQVGYLYFWSFNGETLTPDISPTSGAKITFQSGQASYAANSGWSFDGYSAGVTLSMVSLSNLIIAMPMASAVELDEFAFDISSSATGPKSFSIEYSFDQSTWVMKSEENQFSNSSTAQAKNTFSFDFSGMRLAEDDILYIRITPKAGERGTSSYYNPTTGVTRFDNIRLTGASTTSIVSSTDELHYYIFDAVSTELVDKKIQEFNPSNTNFDISLPRGQYQLAVVRNLSSTPLLLPIPLANNTQFYYSNMFSNHLANIFATETTIVLDQDKQASLTLERYYSQIKFDFTDTRDLSHIKRIVVTPLHQPFYFAPYNPDIPNPILDQSDITLEPNLAVSKEIVFNQFLGNLTTSKPISYRLDVYSSDDDLLRTFDVSASILNNVQVVFRGELLSGLDHQANFQIHLNEDWSDEVSIDF